MDNHSQNKQRSFADYCKTGTSSSEDLPYQELYKQMVFENIEKAMANTYEMTKLALKESSWKELISRFVEEYKSNEPQYWKMPQYLIEFVQTSNWKELQHYPWLEESLRFEWCLTDLYYRKENVEYPISKWDENLDNTVQFTNTWELDQYHYPVYKPKWDTLNEETGNYPVLIYRDPISLDVKIEELNPFLFTFLKNLDLNGASTINEVLGAILQANNINPTQSIQQSATDFCSKLNTYGIMF